MASTTTTFLKSRVSKPTLNKWSSGFSAVKKFAESNDVPLIAVWSNGDACGHCINFEKSLMQSAFTTWQKTSKCVFWFGCSSDKTADDKYQGTGFNWTRNSKLTLYPFVRVYWKSGKVDVAKSGDSWTGGTAKGGATFVKNLQSTLKNYKPDSAPANTTPDPVDEDECDNCNENGGCCHDLTEVCNAVDSISQNVAKLKTDFNASIDSLAKQLDDLKSKCSYNG